MKTRTFTNWLSKLSITSSGRSPIIFDKNLQSPCANVWCIRFYIFSSDDETGNVEGAQSSAFGGDVPPVPDAPNGGWNFGK